MPRYPGRAIGSQHVGLQRRQVTGPSHSTRVTQIPYNRQAQPGPLAFTDPPRPALETIDHQKSRNYLRRQNQHDRRKNPRVRGLDGLKGPQGTLGIFIRKRPEFTTREPGPRRAAHPVHEQVTTTSTYLHADMSQKERALRLSRKVKGFRGARRVVRG